MTFLFDVRSPQWFTIGSGFTNHNQHFLRLMTFYGNQLPLLVIDVLLWWQDNPTCHMCASSAAPHHKYFEIVLYSHQCFYLPFVDKVIDIVSWFERLFRKDHRGAWHVVDLGCVWPPCGFSNGLFHFIVQITIKLNQLSVFIWPFCCHPTWFWISSKSLKLVLPVLFKLRMHAVLLVFPGLFELSRMGGKMTDRETFQSVNWKARMKSPSGAKRTLRWWCFSFLFVFTVRKY